MVDKCTQVLVKHALITEFDMFHSTNQELVTPVHDAVTLVVVDWMFLSRGKPSEIGRVVLLRTKDISMVQLATLGSLMLNLIPSSFAGRHETHTSMNSTNEPYLCQ